MNNSSDYIIIILEQNQTYGHEMTAVFSPVRRTSKSQYPSGNSRRHAGFGPASYTQEDMPMGTTANTGQSTWEQIHGGVRETERLIGQKNYNLAMVKARQTIGQTIINCSIVQSMLHPPKFSCTPKFLLPSQNRNQKALRAYISILIAKTPPVHRY